jgi:hypothetical protein
MTRPCWAEADAVGTVERCLACEADGKQDERDTAHRVSALLCEKGKSIRKSVHSSNVAA